MSKKSIVIFSVVLLACIGLFVFSETAAAAGDFGLGFLAKTDLPKASPTEYVTKIINAVTGVLAVILIAMLVYGGTLYLTSAGSEERVGSAKKTITYAIIGIAVVAAARIIAEFVIGSLTK
ncbi:hypothetical protein KKH43_06770 [Patescibacteria group bacterium]|nr:hypothetical protein [Patescibacteria group bacterium]